MNRKTLFHIGCILAAMAVASASVSAAKAPPATPLTDAGEKLFARYSGMLAALRAEIVNSLPAIDETKKDAFLKAYAAEAAAKTARDAAAKVSERAKDAGEKEAAAKASRAADEAYARAQEETLAAARPILEALAGFLASEKLDPRLIKCAVLADATPRGLAEFAQQGKEEAALIERLLADGALMEQMLLADGAKAGRYGQAMQIYTAIRKASKRSGEGILQRLALGTSLEQAVPVKEFDLTTFVDPVKRYLSYEKAYLDGELDPAVKNMTTWECRLITNCDAPDEQILWGRQMLKNYRPDIVREPDYRWRYSKIVKTDVAYKSPEWIATPRTYQQIINGGGKCGPRAWFGRFALRCFGIPTWGVQQTGHAALTHWTPRGWVVNLGADWRWNWWEGRPGPDFLLETQAREHPKEYLKVLRAQWVGDALGEPKVDGMRVGTGGLWNALALAQKKAIVADAKPVAVAAVGTDIAEANVSTKAEVIARAQISEADRKIVIGKDGVITIPAAACSKPKGNTAKILFMKSFAGGMQLHYNRLGDKPESFEYTFDAPKAGKYALTARVVTVNTDQHLLLTMNDAAAPVDIPLPYTIGMWQESAPVEITLAGGKNVLRFTRSVPNYGLTIKQFVLAPAR